MDIEFHYYITYIVALRAGFKSDEAQVIAYASQYTDDNTIAYSIDDPATGAAYGNYISQTINILKPMKFLMRIYPVFHFVPGTAPEIIGESARRRDGKLHLLNTIPANTNAGALLQAALDARDLYRIGIATHAYCDTFAHQNFVGYFDAFNGMGGLFDKLEPDIGHVDAEHMPDWPACRWRDDRLVTTHQEVDNKERFLSAARCLYDFYCRYFRKAGDAGQLTTDLGTAIGDYDDGNNDVDDRIDRYKALVGPVFVEYEKSAWFDKAVEFTGAIPDWKRGNLPSDASKYGWRENYRQSDWFRFQEAIKAHQAFAMEHIMRPVFATMELENL